MLKMLYLRFKKIQFNFLLKCGTCFIIKKIHLFRICPSEQRPIAEKVEVQASFGFDPLVFRIRKTNHVVAQGYIRV
jgi:hypothetical protein